MSVTSNAGSSANGRPNRDREKLHEVSRANPCPVCDGNDKCKVGDAGFVLCGRSAGPVDGFTWMGTCAKDPQWGQYRRADQSQATGWRKTAHSGGPESPKKRAKYLRHQITDALKSELAEALGLPAGVVGLYPLLGWSQNKSAWTFPEFSGTKPHEVLTLLVANPFRGG